MEAVGEVVGVGGFRAPFTMLALEAAERWPRAAEKAESLTGERHFEKDARLFVRRRDFAAVLRSTILTPSSNTLRTVD